MSEHRSANTLHGQSVLVTINSLNEIYGIYQSSVLFYSALVSSVKDPNLRTLFFDLEKANRHCKTLFWNASKGNSISLPLQSTNVLASKYGPLIGDVVGQDTQKLLHDLLSHERLVLAMLEAFLKQRKNSDVASKVADIAACVQTRLERLWLMYRQLYLR